MFRIFKFLGPCSLFPYVWQTFLSNMFIRSHKKNLSKFIDNGILTSLVHILNSLVCEVFFLRLFVFFCSMAVIWVYFGSWSWVRSWSWSWSFLLTFIECNSLLTIINVSFIEKCNFPLNPYVGLLWSVLGDLFVGLPYCVLRFMRVTDGRVWR